MIFSEWDKVEMDTEVYKLFCQVIFCERVGEQLHITDEFGVAGTVELLKRLEKLGIVKTEQKNEGYGAYFKWEFVPQGLLQWIKKYYLSELKNSLKSRKVNNEDSHKTILAVTKFLNTAMFKEYFFTKIFNCVEKYDRFDELLSIPQDILVDTKIELINPTICNDEFGTLTKAATLIKKNLPISHQTSIQNNVNHYFTQDLGENMLLDLIQKLLAEGIDMIPEQDVYDKAKEVGFSKEKTKELITKTIKQGNLYRPRKEFLKVTKQVPKRWYK